MNDEVLDPLGREAEVQATTAAAKLRAEHAQADLRFVMGDARGRRVMYRLLEANGLYRPSFSPDAGVMAFMEGERNTSLKLLSKLLADVGSETALMFKENQNADA